VYGEGVRILDTRRRGTSKIYVIGEGPDCRPKYELWVYQANSFFEVYCFEEDERLQTIPVALLPFILEAVSTRARVKGEFSGEPLSGDPLDMVRLIRETGVTGFGFGTYQTGPPDSGWIMPSNPRWDANEYRRVSLNEGYHLADNEIQFRLHPGQMFTQEAITEAVVEVVREQARESAPAEGSGLEVPLRTRVFDALNEGVPLGAYPVDNEGVWTYPEDSVWDAERYRHTATYFLHNLTQEERQFRSENGFGHRQALITDLVVQGILTRTLRAR